MLVISMASMISLPREAKAWTSGVTASTTLVGFNWDLYVWTYIPWQASSTVNYTKGWQSGIGGYTQVNGLTHQVKTNTDWTFQYQGLIAGVVSTTIHYGGQPIATYYGLNLSCLIPPWTFWWCDSGTDPSWIGGLPQGSGLVQATMGIGGDGWGTYAGNSVSGSYYWQY